MAAQPASVKNGDQAGSCCYGSAEGEGVKQLAHSFALLALALQTEHMIRTPVCSCSMPTHSFSYRGSCGLEGKMNRRHAHENIICTGIYCTATPVQRDGISCQIFEKLALSWSHCKHVSLPICTSESDDGHLKHSQIQARVQPVKLLLPAFLAGGVLAAKGELRRQRA